MLKKLYLYSQYKHFLSDQNKIYSWKTESPGYSIISNSCILETGKF